jgi:hypothetical protein
MGMPNPFELIFVLTSIMLVLSGAFYIIAPTFGVDVPVAPKFPQFPNLNAQGNQSINATYPFDDIQTAQLAPAVKPQPVTLTFEDGTNTPKHATLNLDDLSFGLSGYFTFERYGTAIIIPWWYRQPIFYTNGTELPLTTLNVQTISDNYNGTASTFIIDKGNNQYERYVSFYPMPGYANIVESWNGKNSTMLGHGFQVRMYGWAYASPDWLTQIVAYLTFFASVIGCFIAYLGWLISVLAAFIHVLSIGLIPSQVAYIFGILVGILFVGSILMFLRGGNNK